MLGTTKPRPLTLTTSLQKLVNARNYHKTVFMLKNATEITLSIYYSPDGTSDNAILVAQETGTEFTHFHEGVPPTGGSMFVKSSDSVTKAYYYHYDNRDRNQYGGGF